MCRQVAVAVVCGIALSSLVGCVSRDEYLRNKFAADNANASRAELEAELQDERRQNQILRAQLEALEREKASLEALVGNLRSENSRLDAYSKDLLNKMNDVLAKGIPGKMNVVEVKLPPELDRALQDFAARYPDKVEYDPVKGVVRWKSDLTFALGSDEVRSDIVQALREFAGIVNSPAAAGFEVVIAGHTDNVPIRASSKRFPSNWHLSCFRSIAVMYALHEAGVDFTRIGCMGYGEHRPRVSNPSRGGEERNRRVEIYLVSSKSALGGAGEALVGADSDGGAPAGSAIPR